MPYVVFLAPVYCQVLLRWFSAPHLLGLSQNWIHTGFPSWLRAGGFSLHTAVPAARSSAEEGGVPRVRREQLR